MKSAAPALQGPFNFKALMRQPREGYSILITPKSGDEKGITEFLENAGKLNQLAPSTRSFPEGGNSRYYVTEYTGSAVRPFQDTKKGNVYAAVLIDGTDAEQALKADPKLNKAFDYWLMRRLCQGFELLPGPR